MEERNKPGLTKTDKVNILIVDDKKANIVALEAILTSPDYNLVSATSGEEGLRQILRHDFAVVLLDVMMPEMDGFEFARLLRQRERSNPTPIIFLTAIAKDSRYLHQGYAVGAVDYLQKPLEAEIVRAKVAVFVELFKKSLRIRDQERQIREAQRREQEFKLLELKREGQRHYQELTEAIPQIVWITDTQGNPSYFNNKWFSYTGIPTTTKLSWDICLTAFHPADANHYQEAWETSLKTGEPLEVEARLFNFKVYGYHWHLCRALPERNEKGEIVAWLGTYTDIHAQKRSEIGQKFLADVSALLATSTDYEHNLKKVGQLAVNDLAEIAILDYVDSDNSVRRLLFHENDEVSKKIAKALELQRNTVENAVQMLAYGLESTATIFNDSLPHNWHTVLQDPDREAVFAQHPITSVCSIPVTVRGRVRMVMTAIYLHGRRFDEFDVHIGREVSRHVALVMENALVHQEAQETNKMKDEFLAVLSHELRTPLNAVIGWSDLLRMSTTDEQILQGLEIIERNGKALNQLVGDLLDVSRIITGKLLLDIRPIDMNSFVSASIEAVRPLAIKKDITLFCHLPSTPCFVNGDNERLQQVLWNLLTNAIKFTSEHGTVDLLLTSHDNQVVITVKDTGIGLKSEIIPHIFERFRQADSSTTRKHGGLGLGLAIVKHVTELHDGKVMAASDGVGRGARFTICLPAALAATTKEVSAVKSVGANRADRSLEDVTVFVVDDDPTARDLVTTLLRRNGAVVSSASSVAAAIAGIRHFKPDILLTDIGMPEEDGYDLLEQLKPIEKEIGRRIRAAALTAYASSADAVRALDAGFEAHITKPVKIDSLISTIAKLAALSRQDRLDNSSAAAVDRTPIAPNEPQPGASM